MTDDIQQLPDQPGVWSQELPAGHIALKGDTDGSKCIPEQIHMMKIGESPPVPEYVSPVPLAETSPAIQKSILMTNNNDNEIINEPGVYAIEYSAGQQRPKANATNAQLKPMIPGESLPVPELIQPVPPADTQSRLTPSERRARLESIAIPEIERLTKAYRNHRDQLEAFEHDRPAREYQLATDYVYRDKQHSKIRMHHIPGKNYLNFALQNGVFTVPPAGQEGATYKPLDINMSNHSVSIHVLCVPENIQSLSELASDAETKKYVNAELKRNKKRLEALSDNALSELEGYKQLIRNQLASIPTIESWLV